MSYRWFKSVRGFVVKIPASDHMMMDIYRRWGWREFTPQVVTLADIIAARGPIGGKRR